MKQGKIGQKRAANITANSIYSAPDKMQKYFESQGGSIDKKLADQKFRTYINSYLKRYNGFVSTTPTFGFKGRTTTHSEYWF